MARFTPTTEQIRTHAIGLDGIHREFSPSEFDRWLAAHEAGVLEASRAATDHNICTSIDELEGLPGGSIVMDANGGLYRKRYATYSANAWYDLYESVACGTVIVQDSYTLLSATTSPRATILWTPAPELSNTADSKVP